MKILSVGFSNILSFKKNANPQMIKLNKNGSLLSFNIGPNGSGKTNMLEILNYIFSRIWFLSCNFENKNLFG